MVDKTTKFVAVVRGTEHPSPWRQWMYEKYPMGCLVVVTLSCWEETYKSWQTQDGLFVHNDSLEILGEL